MRTRCGTSSSCPSTRRHCCPATIRVAGFDNIGSALSISPTLLQAYVSAAATLSRLAVGDPTASSSIATYRAPRDWQNGNHVDGQPLGTRGGFQVQHVFPLDAEYEIRASRRRRIGRWGDDEVELTLDGERAALLPGAGPRTPASPRSRSRPERTRSAWR